jgi:hypothetical protein
MMLNTLYFSAMMAAFSLLGLPKEARMVTSLKLEDS